MILVNDQRKCPCGASIDIYDGKKSYKFKNNNDGFKKLISLSENIKETIFIFEPTGVYSYPLTEFCDKKNIFCVIVSPKVSRDFARSLKVRSKTDKIDAKVLYKYQSHVEANMVKVPKVNHHAIKIQEMLNVYEGFRESKQKLKNQLESISSSHKDLQRTVNSMIKILEKKIENIFTKIEGLIFKDESMQKNIMLY